MPAKRPSKTRDIDQLAADILEEAVGAPAPVTPTGNKNPAAADARRAGVVEGGAVEVKGASAKKRKTAARNIPASRAKAK